MAKITQARVIFDLPQYGARVNDIIEGDARLIKSLKDAGNVDPDKDAVAYAKSEGGAVIQSTDPAETLQSEIDALTQQLAAAADADKPALQATLDAKTAELAAL